MRHILTRFIINEVMYDLEGTDTDREWIEVYNDGAESMNLATYKFLRVVVITD